MSTEPANVIQRTDIEPIDGKIAANLVDLYHAIKKNDIGRKLDDRGLPQMFPSTIKLNPEKIYLLVKFTDNDNKYIYIDLPNRLNDISNLTDIFRRISILNTYYQELIEEETYNNTNDEIGGQIGYRTGSNKYYYRNVTAKDIKTLQNRKSKMQEKQKIAPMSTEPDNVFKRTDIVIDGEIAAKLVGMHYAIKENDIGKYLNDIYGVPKTFYGKSIAKLHPKKIYLLVKYKTTGFGKYTGKFTGFFTGNDDNYIKNIYIELPIILDRGKILINTFKSISILEKYYKRVSNNYYYRNVTPEDNENIKKIIRKKMSENLVLNSFYTKEELKEIDEMKKEIQQLPNRGPVPVSGGKRKSKRRKTLVKRKTNKKRKVQSKRRRR
jgi:hypothetical protein